MALPGNTPLVETQDAPSGYQRRQLAGQCTRNGCPHDAVDGSDLCEAHVTSERARWKAIKRKTRARRRAKGQCIDCGKRVKGDRLCAKHRIERDRYTERATAGVPESVPTSAARIAAATRAQTTSGNEGRVRYHGQGKRGAPSRAVQNAADVAKITRHLANATKALAFADSDATEQLPRIQRKGARDAALALWFAGARLILAMCIRNDVDVSNTLDNLVDPPR